MPTPILSFTFSALNQDFLLPASEHEMLYRVQIVGSGVLTLQLQDAHDGGVTYVAERLTDEDTGAVGTDMTTAGFFVSGLTLHGQPRIRSTAFTSGTLTAFVQTITRAGKHPAFPLVTQLFNGAGQERTLPAALGCEGTIIVQLTGAGTLTIQVQDSLDGGVTYSPIFMTNVNTGVISANMSAAGVYTRTDVAGLLRPRLAVTAFTSGDFTARCKSIARANP